MKTQKRILAITILLLWASLLISCAETETPQPTIFFVTVTPLPLITPQLSTPPTATLVPVPTAADILVTEQTPLPPVIATPISCVPAGWVNYIVQVNDTLPALAERTNVTPEQIQQANCLKDILIFAGQSLYLPFTPPPPTATPLPPTPTVEHPLTPTPMFPATVNPVNTPNPGNPRLFIEPFFGLPGTIYTIAIQEFKSGENINISVFSPGTNNPLFNTFIPTDELGNSVFYFVSEEGDLPGLYTVEAQGETGSFANANLQIISPPTPTVEQPFAPTPSPTIPVSTPIVEQSPTAEAAPTSTVEKPPAGGPGDPTLLIEPFSGPIGTQYTITLSSFVPNETVKVEFFTFPAYDLVLTDFTSVDNTGNGIFQFVSQPKHPIGMYVVTVTSDNRPDKQAFGNFKIGE